MKQDKTYATGQNITADDVATAAGVSRWTVNRAFQKNASISAKSREKVMQAALALGYVPDMRASSLASSRSNLVALLVDDFSNPHKLVMMERLTRILRQNGWDTLLVNTLSRDDTDDALLNASQRRVDAVILIGIQFDDDVLKTARGAGQFRQLIIYARISQHPNTISIAVDDKHAMTEIAEYVLSRGYTRPMFLAGPLTYSAHLIRHETFMNFWKARTGCTPESIGVRAYDSQMAYDRVVKSLSGREPADFPDIIVCENDSLAIGATDALRHHFKLRVPEDIAITGFDDVPQAASPNYNLTTYRQPLTKMAEYLVEVLDNRASDSEDRLFNGHLVIRDSA
ncbi:LacI family transcriptional regulator [Thioclava sp. SK-1]|uniref:LacI family DNA-binding transcriptional regulator n=1 Tax=Thioclava sp. SK-1 TaxID=1889770 RepID=UPI00082668DB|nr:substrate-binding domain-containing protein [Thioclava sp. SK-1]OCX62240.1 LacI family transcriptional regulator [Thioclava sp. SK-1]